MEAAIRTHYKGRLVLARDLMVINVTREQIVTRMAATSAHVWPNKENSDSFGKAERGKRLEMSRWLADKQVFPKF